MGEAGPEPVQLVAIIIISLIAVLVIFKFVLPLFTSGMGKTMFDVMGQMLLSATGYTGIFSGISKAIISTIGSLVPW
ncbi:MAG: hypothetical protein KJ906_00280 [Nanoarchaeota archaeon]|nr:hypothetical protein [Nanoarchaeota archaeon]